MYLINLLRTITFVYIRILSQEDKEDCRSKSNLCCILRDTEDPEIKKLQKRKCEGKMLAQEALAGSANGAAEHSCIQEVLRHPVGYRGCGCFNQLERTPPQQNTRGGTNAAY